MTTDADKTLDQAVAGATDLAFSGPYVGVSYKDLERYGRHDNPTEGFTLDERDAEITQLYAALAVLTRATLGLTSTSPTATWVRESADAVRETERRLYAEKAFPYDAPRFPFTSDLTKLPTANALTELPTSKLFRTLESPAIRHEWTVKPGKRLFEALMARVQSALRSRVCDDQGPLAKVAAQASLVEIGKDIGVALIAILGYDHLFIPIVATIAVILTKRGLREFCAS
jgi:hypothetical protein